MRQLSTRQCFQALPENYPQTFLVIDREGLAAPRAQPKMFYGMTIRGKLALPGDLLEAVKPSLSVIKIRRAFRMGAFQVHGSRVAPFLMNSHTHLKSKIRFGTVGVKLIKSIVRIGLVGLFGDIFRGATLTTFWNSPLVVILSEAKNPSWIESQD